MSITGKIKFFEPSMCIDGEISATSGDSSSIYALDRNQDTKWRSVTSNDLTTETLQIDFAEDKTIDRLFLLDHNWKEFTVKYESGGVWTHFASVIGLDGSKANLSETAFADASAYYEFAEVTTSGIQIAVVKTQTPNQEKYLAQVAVSSEIGTLLGWPEVRAVESDRNARVKKTLSGRYSVQKSNETFGFSIDFKNYPSSSTYNADFDLIMSLQDRELPFMVWLCGGRRSSTYFNYTLRGYRLKDLLTMQVVSPMQLSYSANIYKNPINAKVVLEEHI